MKLEFYDVNDFKKNANKAAVAGVMDVLRSLPLHVKRSDQHGKKDHLIFDPVGANAAIDTALVSLGWKPKIPIPEGSQALGTDIDFGKSGVLVEAQFSNYPFFINNVMRTNALYQAGIPLPPMGVIDAAIIITKAKLFEASNSTLYAEQAFDQLKFLEKAISVPLRVIGLFAERCTPLDAVLTQYHAARYSRTVVEKKEVQCVVGKPGRIMERERITLINE